MTEVLSILLLCLAVYCYAISQLAQHGQLKWSDDKKPHSFWGQYSNTRKYKDSGSGDDTPAFFLSTTLLVFLTDGYHFMQFWMFNFISLSVVFAIGWNIYLFIAVMIGIRVIHWSGRKVFKK